MKKGLWSDEEVKSLFNTVEAMKKYNKSLRQAFESHAKKYTRQPNSVRNYYYHEVDNLCDDEIRRNNLGIDISKHTKNEVVFFSDEEEKDLLNQIDEKVKNGISVRKACLDLSKGDVSLMLRFQNKYRNFLMKHKEQKQDKDNVIKFVNKKTYITDSEIQALFTGLVRLVKKNEDEVVENRFKSEIEKSNERLRKYMKDLNEKTNQIERLQQLLVKTKKENQKLIQQLMNVKYPQIEKLSQKLNKLDKKTL